MPRRFRLRMRPGRAMLTGSTDTGNDPPISAGAGEEVVVSEETTAFVIRQRPAEIIEIMEAAESRDAPP
jgi:hypothetical protein